MKCPHCNFVSFEYLDSCKKCSKDLTAHKSQVGIDFPEPHFFDILTFVESVVSPPPVSDSASPFETDDFSVSGESDSIEIDIEESDDVVAVADEEIDESIDVIVEEEDEISVSLDDEEISEDSGLGLSIGDDESSQTLPGIDDLPGLDETGSAAGEAISANDEIEIDLGDDESEIEVNLNNEIIGQDEVTAELDLNVKDISEEDINIDLDDFSDEADAVSIDDFDLDMSDEGIELAFDESKSELEDELAGSIDDSAESLDLGDLDLDTEDEGSVSDGDIEALSAHADDVVDEITVSAENISDDIDDLEISIGDETLPGLDDFDEDIDLGDLELPDDIDKT